MTLQLFALAAANFLAILDGGDRLDKLIAVTVLNSIVLTLWALA